MTRSHQVALALLFCAALVLPSTVHAQEVADAQAYFEAGAAAYFEGKYAEALVQFKKAQDTVPNALFLYNIALCNLKLSRYREALSAAIEARRTGTLEPREAMQNEARIDAIRTIQTAQARGEAMSAVATTSDPTDVVTTEAAPPAETPNWGALGWVGVVATTAGAGLLSGTLVVELGLQNKWDDYTAAGAAGETAEYNRLKGEIEDGQRLGKILLLSGAGLAAVGLTLIVVELATGPEETVTLRLGPGSVALTGSF